MEKRDRPLLSGRASRRKALAPCLEVAALLAALLLLGQAVPQGDAEVAAPGPRFEARDVWVDPAGEPLAAWQVEVEDPSGRAVLVGVEGGEHPAFAEPPYYDPEALRKGRVVIAAFDTGEDVPSGRTRVARLHFQLDPGGEPDFQVKLTVAASPGGEEVPAKVTLAEVEKR